MDVQLTSQKRQQGLAAAAARHRDLLPVDPQPGHAVSVSPAYADGFSSPRGRRSWALAHQLIMQQQQVVPVDFIGFV